MTQWLRTVPILFLFELYKMIILPFNVTVHIYFLSGQIAFNQFTSKK